MITDPKDGKPGLRLETAASVLVRTFVLDHMAKFFAILRNDRASGKAVHAEYVSALSGTIALMVSGGQGSKEDILAATYLKLREDVDKDLRHLGERP